MNGNTLFAALFALMGIVCIGRAVADYRRGEADWGELPGLSLSSDREGDPVGFTSAIWWKAIVGILAIYMAAWTYFG